jgi:beta-lactamase class A
MKTLKAHLEELSDTSDFDIYWHVRNLQTGEEFSRHGDRVLPAASVRKTSVMMAALNAVHEGRLSLDQPVVIEEHLQKGIVSGVCQYMTPGLLIPMRDAILQMIITSDNICTYEVMKDLELDDLTRYCARIGMKDTVHRTKLPPIGLPENHALEAVTTTTARDQVHLLDLILRGTSDAKVAAALGVTTQLCVMALQFLCWQRFRNMIPALLPLTTKVAHKTGRGQRGWMDAGIVFRGDQPLYILCAITDNVPETMPDGLPGHAAATRRIAQLSRACWDRIS